MERPGLLFEFRLAEHLGMTRRRLLGELDAVELAYWRAKQRIDGPLGTAGDNWRKAGMPDRGDRQVLSQPVEVQKANWAKIVAAYHARQQAK